MSELVKPDSLDLFLKRNAPMPPPAGLREKELAWARIASAGIEPTGWRRRFRIGLAVTLPVALVLAVALFTVEKRRYDRNQEIDRVLGLALAYQLDADEPSDTF